MSYNMSIPQTHRTDWVMTLTQKWLQNDKHLDITVFCLKDGVKRTFESFKCHKLVILPYLRSICSNIAELEDLETIILPSVSPKEFQRKCFNIYYANATETLKKQEQNLDPLQDSEYVFEDDFNDNKDDSVAQENVSDKQNDLDYYDYSAAGFLDENILREDSELKSENFDVKKQMV